MQAVLHEDITAELFVLAELMVQEMLHQNTMAGSVSSAELVVQAVGAKAEGYDAADMRTLAERALHAAACRQLAPSPGLQASAPAHLTVEEQDLGLAQEGFQPAAAWGVGHVQVQPFLAITAVLIPNKSVLASNGS